MAEKVQRFRGSFVLTVPIEEWARDYGMTVDEASDAIQADLAEFMAEYFQEKLGGLASYVSVDRTSVARGPVLDRG